MTVLISLGISILAGMKTIPETAVRAPFEWAGELLGALVAVSVGLVAGVALHVVWGDLNPLTGIPYLSEPPTRLADVPRFFWWRF